MNDRTETGEQPDKQQAMADALAETQKTMAFAEAPQTIEAFVRLMVANLDSLARLAADDGDHITAQVRKFDSKYLGAELEAFLIYQARQREEVAPDAFFASDYNEGHLDDFEYLIEDAREAGLRSEQVSLLEQIRDTLHYEIEYADCYTADHTGFIESPPAPNAQAIARPDRDEDRVGVATHHAKSASGDPSDSEEVSA